MWSGLSRGYGRGNAAGPPERRVQGVTLLELILVMSILALVVGAGLGMFATLDVGERQSVGLVKSVVRTAQNTALTRRSPARVRIDPGNGTVFAEVEEAVGTWHFEGGAIRGAFGMDGTVSGAEFVKDGFLGDALSFGGRRGAMAEIPVQNDPAFDLAMGFSLTCAVRREGRGGGRLLRLGQSTGIEVYNDGSIRAWFAPVVLQKGRRVRGGRVVIQTPKGIVPTGPWRRLRVDYDRALFRVSVDGRVVAEEEESAEIWPVEGPMILSDRQNPFPGSLDSLVVAVVVASETAVLPAGVTFHPQVPTIVYFDAGGGLDRQRHLDPITLGLVFADGSEAPVHVGFYGALQ